MPMSPYYTGLRQRLGHDLLLIPAVAAVIHDKQGRLLLVRTGEDDSWGLPAGAMEPGETPAESVIREAGEETGLDVKPFHLLGVFGGPSFRHTYPNGDLAEYVILLFACTIVGDGKPLDGEVTEQRWFTPAEFPSLALPYPPTLLLPPVEGRTFFEMKT